MAEDIPVSSSKEFLQPQLPSVPPPNSPPKDLLVSSSSTSSLRLAKPFLRSSTVSEIPELNHDSSPEEVTTSETKSNCWVSPTNSAPRESSSNLNASKFKEKLSYHHLISPVLGGIFEPIIGKIQAYCTTMRDNNLEVRADVFKFVSLDLLKILILCDEDVNAHTNVFDTLYEDIKTIIESKPLSWYNQQIKRGYEESDLYLLDTIDLKFSQTRFFQKGKDQSMIQNIIRYSSDNENPFNLIAYLVKKLIDNAVYCHRLYTAHILTYYFFVITAIFTNTKKYLECERKIEYFKAFQDNLLNSLSNLCKLLEWGQGKEAVEYRLLFENGCFHEFQKNSKNVESKIPSTPSSSSSSSKDPLPTGTWCSHQ